MAGYYLAPSLIQLRNEIDAKWPKRDNASDGWVGDKRHAGLKSDHNPSNWPPNWTGVVRAIDIDNNGINVAEVMKELIGDVRVEYVIWNHKIYHRANGWRAKAYYGDPHTNHIHVSIRHSLVAQQSTMKWFGSVKVKRASVDVSVLERIFRENDSSYSIDVKRLQNRLNAVPSLNANLLEDGKHGAKTEAAYFQYEKNLVQKGLLPVANSNITPYAVERLCTGKYDVKP